MLMLSWSWELPWAEDKSETPNLYQIWEGPKLETGFQDSVLKVTSEYQNTLMAIGELRGIISPFVDHSGEAIKNMPGDLQDWF